MYNISEGFNGIPCVRLSRKSNSSIIAVADSEPKKLHRNTLQTSGSNVSAAEVFRKTVTLVFCYKSRSADLFVWVVGVVVDLQFLFPQNNLDLWRS